MNVLSGPWELTAAAKENARTLRFYRSRGQVAEIEYRYKLVPGDCSGDQNPVVIQRYRAIEIIAKRPTKCG